jgi:hypothetical protein
LRKIRDKPTKRRRRSVNAILLGQCDPSRWVRLRAMDADNFKTHEFVKRLQPADTCDVAAPERGPVALTDVARVSTILIRGGYLIRQSTLGKPWPRTIRKLAPRPKMAPSKKKRSLRKRQGPTEGQDDARCRPIKG